MSAFQSNQQITIHLDNTQSAAELRGVYFYEWMQAWKTPKHLLFLKHPLGQAHINLHTYLEFWDKEDTQQYLQTPKKVETELCWTDFKDEEQLNNLAPQEVAELLYLGHRMIPLHQPFFSKLGNSIVYLSREDGEQSTIFMKESKDFFTSLGILLSNKMSLMKLDSTLLGIKRKKELPPIPSTVLMTFATLWEEGLLIDLEKIESTRGKIELPLFLLVDDDASNIEETTVRGKIIYDRKSKEWMAYVL
ncbi:hypothetical protein [Mangrovibacillus cuniculi]|uniref:Uncharacterized protein n=1 Tax=Mangrovibacillus cuniculi TaxID=2593652 RepID=A0A7S8CDZ1_9BACI|nr:hypothetical protein [Mangrovibacillus cuniculi]QPC48162.1 hypothetical protein G8O30_15100 [Mangrovibacillus cuniculi]